MSRSQDELMRVVVGMLTAAVDYKRTGDPSLMAIACDVEGLTMEDINGIVGLVIGMHINLLDSLANISSPDLAEVYVQQLAARLIEGE